MTTGRPFGTISSVDASATPATARRAGGAALGHDHAPATLHRVATLGGRPAKVERHLYLLRVCLLRALGVERTSPGGHERHEGQEGQGTRFERGLRPRNPLWGWLGGGRRGPLRRASPRGTGA